MHKTVAVILFSLTFTVAGLSQTLGEKYKLPEESGELRTDGVYHLGKSLLHKDQAKVEAYFRFFPDGDFIVFHARNTPDKDPENFQAACNYEFVSTKSSAPFNQDHTLKEKDGISRARIVYPDKAVLFEMDVRKDVIQLTTRTFSLSGERIGEPETHIMPFYQISWPIATR